MVVLVVFKKKVVFKSNIKKCICGGCVFKTYHFIAYIYKKISVYILFIMFLERTKKTIPYSTSLH